MRLTPQDIAEATGGTWMPVSPVGVIESISTDTRTIGRGDLFVALRGENFDGHRFLGDAVSSGAAAVVVDRAQSVGGLTAPALVVGDTLHALGDMASAWRARCGARRAAAVGSTGKTTTKDMLGAILRAAGPALVTEGNFNNLVGVPLTLLRLAETDRWAAVEMGMNQPGELERLTRIVDPDVLVFLNVGTAHIGQFGSLDALLDAKGEALRALRSDAAVVYDARSPNTVSILDQWLDGRRAVGFSDAPGADAWADGIAPLPNGGGYAFRLCLPGIAPFDAEIRVFGRYNVSNAVAAAAAAGELGIGVDAITRGLGEFCARAMRSETRILDGRRLVVDCYNANPDSMRAAVESARELASGGRLVLVLGQMLELGGESVRLHEELADRAAAAGPALVLAMGEETRCLVDRLAGRGVESEWFGDHAALAARLADGTREGDVVLVKGSRGNRLEKVLEAWGRMVERGVG